MKTWSNGVQRAGIPDLICCCNGHFLGVEIKAENGKPSKLQEHEIAEIKKSCGIAEIVYPKDFEKLKKIIERCKNETL